MLKNASRSAERGTLLASSNPRNVLCPSEICTKKLFRINSNPGVGIMR